MGLGPRGFTFSAVILVLAALCDPVWASDSLPPDDRPNEERFACEKSFNFDLNPGANSFDLKRAIAPKVLTADADYTWLYNAFFEMAALYPGFSEIPNRPRNEPEDLEFNLQSLRFLISRASTLYSVLSKPDATLHPLDLELFEAYYRWALSAIKNPEVVGALKTWAWMEYVLKKSKSGEIPGDGTGRARGLAALSFEKLESAIYEVGEIVQEKTQTRSDRRRIHRSVQQQQGLPSPMSQTAPAVRPSNIADVWPKLSDSSRNVIRALYPFHELWSLQAREYYFGEFPAAVRSEIQRILEQLHLRKTLHMGRGPGEPASSVEGALESTTGSELEKAPTALAVGRGPDLETFLSLIEQYAENQRVP